MGHHSNETVEMVAEVGLRRHVSEPQRGRRRRRSELIERVFANGLETGGVRRVHRRGRENIRQRHGLHVAGFNRSFVLRWILDDSPIQGALERRPAGDGGVALAAVRLASSEPEQELLRL